MKTTRINIPSRSEPKSESRQPAVCVADSPLRMMRSLLLGAIALGGGACCLFSTGLLRSSSPPEGWGSHSGGLPPPSRRFFTGRKSFYQHLRPPTLSCVPGAGLPSCPPLHDNKAPRSPHLAMCVITRDELDLGEWIQHHRELGAGTFYIFDHASVPPLSTRMPREVLMAPDVRYEYFNRLDPPALNNDYQMPIFHTCVEKFGKHHTWMAMLDADEFLAPTLEYLQLNHFLRQFHGQCAITLNWRIIGSGNHTSRPAGGVIDNYTNCYDKNDPMHLYVKYIVAPSRISFMQSPHTVRCRNGQLPVNEDNVTFGAPEVFPILGYKMEVYHYLVKSAEEFYLKAQRGGGTGDKRNLTLLQEVDAKATENCFRTRDARRFLEGVHLR